MICKASPRLQLEQLMGGRGRIVSGKMNLKVSSDNGRINIDERSMTVSMCVYF